MNTNKIVNRLVSAADQRIYSRIASFAYNIDNKRRLRLANVRSIHKQLSPLSKEEMLEFKKNWDGYDSVSFCFYKAFGCQYNPEMVPNDYYDFAEHVLNLRWAAFFLQHKCNLKHIIPASNRPVTLLQKIDGHYVFEDNTEIIEAEARKILSEKDEFVCKVALGTGGGRGVLKVNKNDAIDYDYLFKPKDLIFQDVIHQNEFLSSFNADSVNTFRFLTLNINGKCTVLSSFLRMGAKGSFVDNLCTGGGVLVGVDHEGKINAFGINKKYEKVYSAPSGIAFDGLSVPNWHAINEKVIGFHQHIPYANLIGWDITLNDSGEPIVIEINLDHAEIEAHQVFNGPVFRDRLQEVKEYIKVRTPLLRHAMITY